MLRKPKDIGTLYDEVAEYDIILTTDAPLATALNMRIARPTLGKRAFTPKEIAAKYAYRYFNEALLSDGEAVAEVARRLSMPIKQAHNAMRQIIDIRTHASSIEQFLNEGERDVYRTLSTMATPQRARELFEPAILSGKRVAVIGKELFNELDKLVLPHEYDEICIFSDERYDPAPLYVLPSDDAVVASLGHILTKESENDIALITSTSSGLTTRLKSYLYGKGITINERLFLHDNLAVRGFLSLLSYSRRMGQTTVGEIRPFLEPFGLDADQRYDDYNFEEYACNHEDGARVRPLFDLLRSCDEMTFGEVAQAIWGVQKMNGSGGRKVTIPVELNTAIGTLGLWNARVTDRRLSDLSYFIYNINIKIESTKKGVVIVDCNQALYVDRPICIYIGLDGAWSKEPRNAPYVDTAAEQERDIMRFEAMLSQGVQRLYLTTRVRSNEGSVPSYYFNIIYGRAIGGFDDPLFGATPVNALPDFTSPQPPETLPLDGGVLDCFSQSSLNKAVTCPKMYEYSRLTTQKDRNVLLKGTLLHAFAEFYTAHPAYVREQGGHFFAALLLDHYMGIVKKESKDMEYTNFAIAVENIMAFVDSCTLSKDVSLVGMEKPSWRDENYLAKTLGMRIDSPNVELFFKDDNLHLKGVIDLIIDKTAVVDYKSSRYKKTPSEIMKQLTPALYTTAVDFQPLVYLLKLRAESPGTPLSFYYCFFLANKKDTIAGTGNHTENTVTVRYMPIAYAEFLADPQNMDYFATSKARSSFLEAVGAGSVAAFFKRHPLPTALAFEDNIAKTAYGVAFSRHFEGTKDAIEVLKEALRFRRGKGIYNRTHQVLYLFSEDLDGFEAFLAEQLKKMAKYRTSGYPKAPLDRTVCKNCEYRDLCCEGW